MVIYFKVHDKVKIETDIGYLFVMQRVIHSYNKTFLLGFLSTNLIN